MVTDALIGVLRSVLVFFLQSMPTATLPAYLTGTGDGTMNGTVTSLAGSLWSLDALLPVSHLIAASALVLTALVASVAIRLVRILASFLTAGGGSAA